MPNAKFYFQRRGGDFPKIIVHFTLFLELCRLSPPEMEVSIFVTHFMETDSTAAVVGFAIAMLVVVFTSMGFIGMLLFSMKRNASRRDPQVDELLEEMEESTRKADLARTHGDEVNQRIEPWEREGDWWKNKQ